MKVNIPDAQAENNPARDGLWLVQQYVAPEQVLETMRKATGRQPEITAFAPVSP